MDTSLFEKFQKFLVMYERFEIIYRHVGANFKSFLPLSSCYVKLSYKSLHPFSKWILDSCASSQCTCSVETPLGQKLAKFSAQPFSNRISSSTAPFDLVYSNVWGPAPISTKGGSRYYVSFIDDFTRYTWVYLMKRRSDFLTVFKEFRAIVKTQHSVVGLFIRPLVRTLLNKMVFLKESIAILLRQLDHSCCLHVLSVFWGEAVLTATYVINRIPTARVSPFEKLYGTSPDYSLLHVFGYTMALSKYM
ncbi:gag-pol polyprotein [Tanacetum coccineum]